MCQMGRYSLLYSICWMRSEQEYWLNRCIVVDSHNYCCHMRCCGCLRNESATDRLAGWKLDINQELVRIPGRILPPETIHQGQKKSVSSSLFTITFFWLTDAHCYDIC